MIWRYKVTGTVLEAETGRALANLVVRGWDKDLLFDDYLGDTLTDESGHFELEFTDERFRQVFDQDPDLYRRIYDPSGTHELHSTRASVRRDASAEEHYEIRIPADRLGDG